MMSKGPKNFFRMSLHEKDFSLYYSELNEILEKMDIILNKLSSKESYITVVKSDEFKKVFNYVLKFPEPAKALKKLFNVVEENYEYSKVKRGFAFMSNYLDLITMVMGQK